MELTAAERARALTDLQGGILRCRLCEREFGRVPRPIVQGVAHARVMHISQAPSRRVHETGRPFDDLSGKKLRGAWYQISDEEFYNPELFYIASAAHCYPGKAPGGGDRRPPPVCAREWLMRELELVDCELYLIVGGYAAALFFPGESITSLAFQDRELRQKPAYVLPHPSPLNMKWFRDHPQFEQTRMPEIRRQLHAALYPHTRGADAHKQ